MTKEELDRTIELERSIVRLLAVVEALMPGVRYIAVKNYKELNEAPIDARRILSSKNRILSNET